MKKMYFLILVCTVVFFPVTLPAEMNFTEKFDWKDKRVKTLCSGVEYVRMAFTKPRLLKISAVRIALATPSLRFKVMPRAKKWGEKMPGFPELVIRTERKTCRSFMEESVQKGENMIAAVNSNPWSPWQKPWNHPYGDRTGLMIADGVLVSPPYRKYPSFVVDKSGKCFFAVYGEKDDLSNIRHAVSGFGFVLKKGKVLGKDNGRLAPRTNYGLSSCGKYLILFVCDGRQKEYSMGCSTYETGEFLKYFGCSDALNMDGGGSTTLFLRNEKGLLKLNRHRNGAERKVGGAMGIIIDK